MKETKGLSSLSGLNRLILFRIFFFSVFIFLLFQFIRLLSPFFTPLMCAVTLTLVFYPLYTWLKLRVKNPNAAAAISVGIILLVIIIPFVMMGWLLIRESVDVLPAAKQWLQNAQREPGSFLESLPAPVAGLWTRVETYLALWQINVQQVFLDNLDIMGKRLTGLGAGILKNIFFITFDFLIMVFTLFFFLRDGARMTHWVVDLIPMETAHKEQVMRRFDRTLSAVVRGVFITATTQGVLATLGFLLMGVKFPVLLGFATSFLALIPFVGATAVWLPVALFVLLKGVFWKGIFLLVWGAFVVSLVDNFLRPIIIGEKAKLPVLLLFLGILGGLQVYGFIGILLGPLMIATVLAFVKIYREQYQLHAETIPPAP